MKYGLREIKDQVSSCFLTEEARSLVSIIKLIKLVRQAYRDGIEEGRTSQHVCVGGSGQDELVRLQQENDNLLITNSRLNAQLTEYRNEVVPILIEHLMMQKD